MVIWERCSLRPGNVHSADNWQAALDPVIERYRWAGLRRKYLCGDAAFATAELFDYLEDNDFGYAVRLRANMRSDGALDPGSMLSTSGLRTPNITAEIAEGAEKSE